MKTTERFKEIEDWYNTSKVKFEVIKALHDSSSNTGREFALLIPSWMEDKSIRKTSTRMLKVHSVQHFDYWIKERLRMIERKLPYNMYYSLSAYTGGIPNQTANFNLRDNSEWESRHYDYMQAYDFLIDIDAGSHEEIEYAYLSAKLVINYFNSNNIPYELRFSGKGFHIIIPYRYFSKEVINKACFKPLSFNPKDDDNLYRLYYKLAEALKNRFSEMIDTGIYDSRRICKIPFSLALYEDNIFVCYPFVDLQDFTNFNLQNYELANFNEALLAQAQGMKKRKIFNYEGNITSLLKLI